MIHIRYVTMNSMRDSFNGRTSVFQTERNSSILLSRSIDCNMNLRSAFEYIVSAVKALLTFGQDCSDSNIVDTSASIA
jgi:hypothetical protein